MLRFWCCTATIFILGMVSPVVAKGCVTQRDLTGAGVVVEFDGGTFEIYKRREDGLVEVRFEDGIGSIRERSRFGLFLVDGFEIETDGKRITYAEIHENIKYLKPPAPDAQLQTFSVTYTDGVRDGRVSSVWQAGAIARTQLGDCSYDAYLIEVDREGQSFGFGPEQYRYLYLPAMELGLLLDVIPAEEEWPPLSMPTLRPAG